MTVGLLSFASGITPFDQAFLTPFSPQSLWNARPVSPVLGTTAIAFGTPFGTNNCAMANSASGSSTGFFYATASDPPQNITCTIADEQANRVVTLPHWPASALPAWGPDHQMNIYDSTTRTIHAFWDTVNSAPGVWSAGEYETYSIDGTGWATPTRPAGPRACGISAVPGMLRTWEYGLPILNHATIFGTSQSSVLNGPVFPATQQDQPWSGYSGPFPLGTLFMLPPTFDPTALPFPTVSAMCLARTLMKFGAYLIDTSDQGAGGGMNFYGEQDSNWDDNNTGGFNPTSGADDNLIMIRNAMRAVVSVGGWLDGNGNPFTPTPWSAMQILSMRGPWNNFGGGASLAGFFNTVSNLFEFPDTTSIGSTITNQTTRFQRDNTSIQPWHNWANFQEWYVNPVPGAQYQLSCVGSGPGVSASMEIYDSGFNPLLGPGGSMTPGQSVTFTWPNVAGTIVQAFVTKTAGAPASIRLELIPFP